ncbi:FAD-binding oxidoreductase [Streptomyces sp. NPDC020965]|uniref:FAD-binding oxidoreductase n=1 Tax=Streptomyces sp. NPDC020965 TaxID=3365105 RepID=UPI0037A177FE
MSGIPGRVRAMENIAQTTFRPGDAGYDDESAGFQTGCTVRPDLIVAATDAEEVRRAVAHAAAHGLPVGVQATGHGRPGPSQGGVLISTRRMDGVRIDPVTRTARIEAGVRWGQVVAAAAPYGLAPLSGSAPTVGAVSYTLGGGLGLLARQFGYTADHVRAIEVVTGDGEPRRVTSGELYWALLGAGAGLGVVTAIEIGLVPVTRLYGGGILFGDGPADDVARAYLEWAATVPDELTSSLGVMVYPDLPMVPAHLRGRRVTAVRVAYTGSAAAGERLVAPLRAIGPALEDSLRELPYTDSATIHNDPDQPHAYYGDNAMLSGLDADAFGEVLRLTGPDQPVWTVTQLSPLGGALRTPAPNAVPYREAAYAVRTLSLVTPDTDVAAIRALYEKVYGGLGARVLGRSLNFVFGAGERPEGLYDAETLERIGRVKAAYDPGDLFRRPGGGPGRPS